MDRYARRRRRFLDATGTTESVVAVIPGARESIKSRDVHHPFRQNSYFQYLTGFPEPDSWAVIERHGDQVRFTLVVRPHDPERETWDGRRAGTDGAMERFGADAAFPVEELDQVLTEALSRSSTVYFPLGADPENDARFHRCCQSLGRRARQGVHPPSTIVHPAAILDEMRLLKDEDDLGPAREAARITVEAHAEAVRVARPGITENEIQAVVEYVFRTLGASGPAYPSIVGCGDNATILHYHENNCRTRDDQLILIDAGAEVECYAADITRTFPVSGSFTEAQAEAYRLVLAAQEAAIDAVRPGAPFEAVHAAALQVLVPGLVELGILDGEPQTLIENGAYRHYYMHQTSHWLGLDVHDVGHYRTPEASRPLTPGMVLTVEPGLYFPDAPPTPERYRGIGIRIEDDVLVTETGCEVLTEGMPKTIEGLAALRDEAPRYVQRPRS